MQVYFTSVMVKYKYELHSNSYTNTYSTHPRLDPSLAGNREADTYQ